jgi:hypothetical protein
LKKIFVKVYDNQLLICVGDNINNVEYIVGESILNVDSEKEKKAWQRAIRVAFIDDFENIIKLGSESNITECFNLISEIKTAIEQHDEAWYSGIIKLKKMAAKDEM